MPNIVSETDYTIGMSRALEDDLNESQEKLPKKEGEATTDYTLMTEQERKTNFTRQVKASFSTGFTTTHLLK